MTSYPNAYVYSWIFMLPITCSHQYSCYPWRLLTNIHVTRDVYSWISILCVTCTHEYSCYRWCVLMNTRVSDVCHEQITRDVCSWKFNLPVTCSHEYHVPCDVTHEYSCYLWCVLMNIQITLVLMNFQLIRDVYSWIFMLPVTCTHE